MPALRLTPCVDDAGDIYLIVLIDGVASGKFGPLRADEEIVVPFVEEKKVSSPPTRQMKKLSRKQEQRNAELIGGRRQPGSGCSPRAKGDVRKMGEWRGESKFTFAASYPLTRAVLEKITSECGLGEKPILFLDFKNSLTNSTYGSYVVLHETDFEELVNHGSSDD